MAVQEPLLPLSQNRKSMSWLHSRALRRALVVGLILLGALTLALALPTNKNLPCPYCKISSVIGWLYFLAWSISFWPQVYSNYRRKSVEGLSFDFTVLNVLGFACYTQFNLSLFLSPTVRQEYMLRFRTPDIPVELNDVVFGIHAFLLSSVLALQCIIYPKHDTQRVSWGTSLGMAASVATGTGMALFLAVSGEGARPWTWLDLCYFCSFIKMAVTLVKYIPQVHMNHSRQSTEGWSIDNVLLDMSGGVLSVAQQLISCQVLKDWSAVTGNPIKFGLGLVSIGFDVVFILQHYVWFRSDTTAQVDKLQQEQQHAEEQHLQQEQEVRPLLEHADSAASSHDQQSTS